MPLFDVSGGAIRPFRRLNSGAEVYESEIEHLFWSDLETFAGEPLFAIARQAKLPGGGIPDIIGLDIAGRVVVIEVKRDIERSQLAQCLEYAGWARRTNLEELASLYFEGTEQFFIDWQEFTGTATPMMLDRFPRLMLVARSFDARTESALQYLQESGVPVKLVTIVFYEDAQGNRILDVNNGGDTTAGGPQPPVRSGSGASSFGGGRSPVGVSLTDLLEAGLIQVGEVIEWRRPQIGDHFTARVDGNGSVVTQDGQTFTSLSSAADRLTGGSYNGWECWSVPRLGGAKIGSLRGKLAREAASQATISTDS